MHQHAHFIIPDSEGEWLLLFLYLLYTILLFYRVFFLLTQKRLVHKTCCYPSNNLIYLVFTMWLHPKMSVMDIHPLGLCPQEYSDVHGAVKLPKDAVKLSLDLKWFPLPQWQSNESIKADLLLEDHRKVRSLWAWPKRVHVSSQGSFLDHWC